MATNTVTNYTDEQTQDLKATYLAEPTKATVEALAAKYGKTVRSVVAKLAKEQVYKAKDKEAGKRTMLKAEMVGEISTILNVPEEVLESLEKATGPALMAVLTGLRQAKA